MEGVGEEVIYTFGFILLLLVAFIIWRMSYVMEPMTSNVAHSSSINDQATSETIAAEAGPALNRTRTSDEIPSNSISTEQVSNSPLPTENESLPPSPVQPSGPLVTVRIKFLDERSRLAQTCLSETLGAFRRKHLASEITPSSRVRLIFNGHELRGSSRTLADFQVREDSTIHCLVQLLPTGAARDSESEDEATTVRQRGSRLPSSGTRSPRQAGGRAADGTSQGAEAGGLEDAGGALVLSLWRFQLHFEIGSLLLPLVSLFIGFLWVLRFSCARLFTGVATAGLVVLTLMLVCGVLFTWLQRLPAPATGGEEQVAHDEHAASAVGGMPVAPPNDADGLRHRTPQAAGAQS